MLPDDAAEPGGGTPPEGETTPHGDDEPGEKRIVPNPQDAAPFSLDFQSLGAGPSEDRPPSRDVVEREVKVLNVYQYPSEDKGELTFVLLQDGKERKLPIFIGHREAEAIVMGLQKDRHDFHRPLTHDLIRNAIIKLGGKIERLTIDDMWQETFYARLVVSRGSEWIDIDCRPSDGIAVALRAEAPIYVSDHVLDECHYREE